MLYPRPSHIRENVYKLPDENMFLKYKFDSYTMCYKVKCTCGNEEFEVFTDSDPTVIAKCAKCKNEIIVYDLKYYPAASAVEEEEDFKKYISCKDDKLFNLCVIYEYSDEFEFEDEEFDSDDITWCQVYVYGIKSKEVFKIVDDETA